MNQVDRSTSDTTPQFLSKLAEKTRQNLKLQGSVEMFASFNHHGHMCIVFEVLGKSVFDFLKDNGFTPFPLAHIQRMADDVLAALSFLHGNFTCHDHAFLRTCKKVLVAHSKSRAARHVCMAILSCTCKIY